MRMKQYYWLPITIFLLTLPVSLYAQGSHTQGPLQVLDSNPRWFTQDGEEALYLTGSHLGWELQDDSWGRQITFDYTAWLDTLVSYNHNLVRLWSVEDAMADTANPAAKTDPMPYLRTGPGLAMDGLPKFDLTQFNPAYFERIRARIIEAGERDMYVLVMLFQGWSIEKHGRDILHGNDRWSPWNSHPFHKDNNVNGIDGDVSEDGDGEEMHTLAHRDVKHLQETYVRHVIETVNDLDNIIYEISNESHSGSTIWQWHFIDYIHDYEKWMPKQHPVFMSYQACKPPRRGNNSMLWRSNAEAVSPGHHEPYADYRYDPPINDGSKVILLDTDHIWGVKGGENGWAWKCFMRGIQPVYMDIMTRQEEVKHIEGIPLDPEWIRVRHEMGDTRRFAERVDLARMLPTETIASTGYCLYDAGSACLVYAPDGGDFTVNLTDASGEFSVEWYDTVRRTTKTASKVSGGRTVSFTPPFDGPAVLLLDKELH
jgi:hypothetical protein